MKQIIDQIREMYRIGCEIDAQVPTCGMGPSSRCQWHIHGFRPFKEAALTLNDGKFELKDRESKVCRYECSFTVKGVYVFCLIDSLEEMKDDAPTAN